MMNKRNVFAAVLMLSVATLLFASDGTDGVRMSLRADDLVVVQAGEKIYQSQCASCHGVSLEGQADWRTRDAQGYLPAPPHDATGHTWHHADDLLFEITKYGPAAVINDASYITRMPAYQGILSDDEIIAVLSFIKNTWPEEQRAWQDDVNGTDPTDSQGRHKKRSSLIDRLLK